MLVKCIFYSAERNQLLDYNPAEGISAKGGKPAKKKDALTDEQAKQLLEATKGLPPYVFIMIGLYSGLRREEILALQWDCVHLDVSTPYISVRRAWRTEHNRPVISTVLKTEAAKRDIPIPKCLVECLQEAKVTSISDYVIADMAPPMYVATNEDKVQGAAVMFYPDFMDQAAKELGGDVFVLPSSVHEVLILPDDGSMSVDELRDMVTTINATEVSAQDRLADSVYHYDAATRVFELGEKFEERQAQKESTKEERSSVLKDLKDKKQDMDLKPKAPGRPKTKDEPANVADDFDNVFEVCVLGAVASLFHIEKSRTAITGRNICDWNDPGRIDEPVKWNLSKDGTLTVRGFIIPDAYRPEPDVPWRKHREEIKRVVVSQGIRIIGMHAFYDLPNLESATISHSVTDIRCGAFANCPKLETVEIGRKTFDISDFKQIKYAPVNTVIVWPEAFANTAYSETDPWVPGTDYAY